MSSYISHLDDIRFMARTTPQIVLLFSLNMKKKKVNALLTYFQAKKKNVIIKSKSDIY
jgi:hypothetical protein